MLQRPMAKNARLTALLCALAALAAVTAASAWLRGRTTQDGAEPAALAAVPAPGAAEPRLRDPAAPPERATAQAASAPAAEVAGTGRVEVRLETGSAGTPVTGLAVVAVPDAESRQGDAAISDGAGVATFELEAGRPWWLAIPSDRALGTLPQTWAIEPLSPGQVRSLLVPIQRGVRARGFVVDELGRGIAGARVRGPGAGSVAAADAPEAESAEDGSFELGPLPARFSVFAEVDGYACRFAPAASARPGETVSGLRIVLARPRRVVGRVTCEGRSVADARVEATFAPAIGESGAWGGPPPPEQVGSAPDGAFELRRVAADQFRLRVEAPGMIGRELELEDPSDPLELSIELARAMLLRVRVVDRSARPVPGCRVRVFADVPGDVEDVVTGADGVAVVPGVPRGAPISVFARAAGFVLGQMEDVVAGDDGLSFALDACAPLAGRVVDRDGRGVARARVTAYPIVDGTMRYDWLDCDLELGEDGSFAFETLPAGTYALVAERFQPWRYLAPPVTAATGTSPELVLDPSDRPLTTLRATVRDALSGLPIPRFTHTVYVQNFGTVVPARDGAFTLPDLPSGEPVWVLVAAEGYDPWKLPERPLAAPAEALDIRLWPLRDLAVRVESGSGEALPLAQVEACDDAAAVHCSPRGAACFALTPVDREGNAMLRDLPARPLRIRASAWQGGPEQSASVDLSMPPVAPLVLTLPATPTTRVALRFALAAEGAGLRLPRTILVRLEAAGAQIGTAALDRAPTGWRWRCGSATGGASEPVLPLVLPRVPVHVAVFATGFGPVELDLAADPEPSPELHVTLRPLDRGGR